MDNEQKMNIDLCLEVEKYPCLYDVSLGDHAKRQILEKTWAEIGEKMALSGAVCKKRWMNIRTVYVRRRSKAPKSGSAFKKEYYLHKYLQFLVPHIKLPVESTGTNLLFPDLNQLRRGNLSPSVQAQSNDIQATNVNLDFDVSQGEIIDCKQEPCISSVNTFCPQQRKRSEKPLSAIDQPFLEYFSKTKQKLSDESENPRKYFLLSLLPEVNQLPEGQFKIFKRRVLSLIDELDMPQSTT